uniref:Putative ovule protein n=1 Tax=Solanum chacoense TaxID=4108 RepID=A0A0V0I7J1_SOLCH
MPPTIYCTSFMYLLDHSSQQNINFSFLILKDPYIPLMPQSIDTTCQGEPVEICSCTTTICMCTCPVKLPSVHSIAFLLIPCHISSFSHTTVAYEHRKNRCSIDSSSLQHKEHFLSATIIHLANLFRVSNLFLIAKYKMKHHLGAPKLLHMIRLHCTF